MNAYDFDETIYDGESSVDFFLYCFKYDPKLIRFLPAVLKAYILYKKEKISLDEMLNKYGKELEDYFSSHQTQINNLVKSFWDKRMNKIKPFYLELQKEDDVIITASPRFMIQEICERLGVKNLICTEFNLESGKIEKLCFRESKVDCFREVYPTEDIDDFYTDSMNDKFLMPFSKRVFLVKGHKIKQVK